ncbi:MAG: sigma-70 family RNA polymerase sigma factor [Clostridia bacterium]|nr:sigma-70 family RNA polymerase sigma factor [Clostridia bacterium]
MDCFKGPDNPQSNEEKITQLINTYQLSLKRMCCVWLKDAALAEDATQETFLKAYAALSDFRGECSEKTWLTRIAVNVCRNLRRGWWFDHVDRSVEIERLPEAAVPFEDADSSLIDTVAALPLRLREITMLYYYQDMNMSEISEALNISVSTVSRRLEKARRQLRTQLEKEGMA